jgi:lipoprotein-releasing system ATP-binding protein
MEGPLLSAQGLRKSYYKGAGQGPRSTARTGPGGALAFLPGTRKRRGIEVPVLMGVDLTVEPGEFVSVVGQSGSGKTTLLHLLGTLDTPDAGEIHLAGRRIDNLPPRPRDRLRNETFGFIFQFYHLLPELDAVENVLTPLYIRHGVLSFWRQRRELRREAERLLERVGLAHRMNHKPSELSGGEMQRTAIARALAQRPQVLLADEPTGNLDGGTGQEIIDLVASLNHDEGLTIIMVTHDPAIAARAHRTVRIEKGRIETPVELSQRIAS